MILYGVRLWGKECGSYGLVYRCLGVDDLLVELLVGVAGLGEEFVVRVFKGGKVTVPRQLRALHGVEDGNYVRLALVEVMRKGDDGAWVKRKVRVE
jgi:hypothetical protein